MYSRYMSVACIDFFSEARNILSTILDFFTMSAIFINRTGIESLMIL